MRVITPSRTSPWEGTPVEGMRYTRQQLYAMKVERPTWAKFEDCMVNLAWRQRFGSTAATASVPCPIIARSRDRKRVLVIAPGGDKIWLDARP